MTTRDIAHLPYDVRLSRIRTRMLRCLQQEFRFCPTEISLSARVSQVPDVRDLLDLRGFGWAALYEMRDWLAEFGSCNVDTHRVIARRESLGDTDPRSGEPRVG